MVTAFCAIFSLLFAHFVATEGLQCKNENNEPVDWFTVYKIPKIEHDNELIKSGVGYLYVTSENYLNWTLSNFAISDNQSIIAKTLTPFFSRNASYVFYNDQPPNEPSKSEKGHTKGVILSDVEGGFWLIHSVPHFLELTSQYSYPKTGLKEGQSFLCISLDLKNLNKVGVQLQFNEPQIYASYISEVLQTKLGKIVEAASGAVVKTPPWYNQISITTLNGASFHSFAKSRKFGKDLYHDWVAPSLTSDLLTETWLNGDGRLPSNCTNSINVFNIETLSIKGENISFSDSQDHSKWAVSLQSSWICIGDINRMNHQKFRGGGTVCLNNLKLSENYRNSVKTIEKCLSTII